MICFTVILSRLFYGGRRLALPDPKAGSEAKSSATAPQSQQKRFLLYAGLAVLVLLLVAASIYLVKSNKAPGQPPTPSGSREAETKENGEVLPRAGATFPWTVREKRSGLAAIPLPHRSSSPGS